MNDMTIGMENLPNIFIDKIIVEKLNSYSKIKITVGAFDYIDEDLRTWKRDEMLTAGLKFKIVFENSIEKSNNLDSGTASLFDYELGENVLVLGAGRLNQNKIIGNTLLTQDIQFYYTDVFMSVDNNNASDLNVYACFFIDGLQFENSMFNKFYGPLSGEVIFRSGILNKRSNYFYNPNTNEEYGGPVHLGPNGNYMEGSEHREMDHSGLILVEEENFKIINERVEFTSESPAEDLFSNESASNATTSTDEDYQS